MQQITVIGAGLAGSEAAWQLAERGIMVNLYEMRPTKTTPAHQTDRFAELVCSNSLRGAGIENAVGLLKEEMRRLGSLIMEAADHNAVPAGGALAVDRELFSSEITKRLEQHPNVRVHREEVHSLPVGMTIVASGPLTSDDLALDILKATGEQALSFYDAAAPIVTLESIDLEKAFWASRYDKGDADYLNCPMTREEYEAFYKALVEAEMAEVQGYEQQGKVFEGCLPVEVMAKRGIQTLTFGPLKPVGLIDPRTGKKSHAVVQLRKENQAGTLFNLVGFQTHLKWGEQKRVFSLIPGLEKAEFVRYGVMHRNTFLNAPKVLKADFSLRLKPELFFAGQMTGVEGYVESAASGLLAGLNAWRRLNQLDTLVFPPESSLGALARHLEGAPSQSFQPMNINFGLLPPLSERIRDKRQKNARISERALAALAEFCAREDLGR